MPQKRNTKTGTKIDFHKRLSMSYECDLSLSVAFVRDGSLTLMEPDNGFVSPPLMIGVRAFYNVCIALQSFTSVLKK